MNILHRWLCHITIMLLCLAFNGAVQAQDNCGAEVYAVTDIHLDENATTGMLAREQAIKAATEQAYQKILRRILVPNQDSAAAMAAFNAANFVDFIHIDNENALAQRYIADIDICFDAARMRAALIENDLEWAEFITAPILLLPVWQDPSGVRVWTRNVLWLDSWRTLEMQRDSLVRTAFLEPDFVLERQLKGSLFLNEDIPTLQKAAKAAGAAQIVLLYAGLDYSAAQPALRMQAILFNQDGGKLGTIAETQLAMDGQTSMQIVFETFQMQVIDALETGWRQANLYVVGGGDDVFVEVGAASPASWYRAQEILAELPVVTSVSVHSLTADSGVLKLQISGPVEALQLAVLASGYRLDITDNAYQMRVNPTQRISGQ